MADNTGVIRKLRGAAFVTSQYPPTIGGAELRASRLASELARRGVRVTVLTRALPGAPRAELSGNLAVLRLGPCGGGLAGGLFFYASVLLELARRRADYEVIQNFLLSTLTPLCCAAGAMLGKPVFVSLGGAGARGGLNDSTGTGRLSGLKKALLKPFSPVFTTPNLDGLRELFDAGTGEERARLIPNPADPEAFSIPAASERAELRRKLGFTGPVFLFAGRFVQDKNLPLLGKAWKIFSQAAPDATLALAGDGPERPAFERFVRENALEGSVRLEGLRRDMPDYYRAADFFVLSSDNEGMSNALLEAMLCGLTPLVKNISGCELVEDGRNGLKTDRSAAPEQFAELLSRAAALPESERVRLGQAARNSVLENCTLEKVADAFLKLYLEKL